MPALKNPRHEAFAQAILFGLYNSDRETYSNGRAYQRAGYLAKDAGKSGGSAEAAASRLLKKVQPILARVRELQAEHIKHLQPKLDISKERIGRRLDKASQIAEQQQNPANMVAAELGLAKVFHRVDQPDTTQKIDFNSAQSLQDIGRKLLQSIGFKEPDDVSIAAALVLNDTFISGLEQIRDKAQTLTVEHRDS